MDARCQCGAVHFKTPLEKPLKIYICHCIECQRQASSTYGVTLKFPVFEIPQSAKQHLKVWNRITYTGEKKECWFCDTCGSRILHYIEGSPTYTLKACVDGLTREMMDRAVHIWAKRAITPIPTGAVQYDEEELDEQPDIST